MIDLEEAGQDLRRALGGVTPSVERLHAIRRRRRVKHIRVVAICALMLLASVMWFDGRSRQYVQVATSQQSPRSGAARSSMSPGNLPASPPVGSTPLAIGRAVIVSKDGLTITAVGLKSCGLSPLLIASPFAGGVSLTWADPPSPAGVQCSDVAATAIGSTSLSQPLAGRELVEGLTGTKIPYFNEEGLADVRQLPSGYVLSKDEPVTDPAFGSGAIGDTRVYVSNAGGTAPLSISQVENPAPSNALPALTGESSVVIDGSTGVLRTELSSAGAVVGRSVQWAQAGYTFAITSQQSSDNQPPISERDLLAVAKGIQA